MRNKAQLSIFIIIGVVLVAAIVGYFLLRDNTSVSDIPVSIDPVYKTFLSCLEQDTFSGVDVLETQAGYIYMPEFESGSSYMPFSSQLDFLGNPIPYWYYVSGNNIQREKIPSKSEMEIQLQRYVNERVRNCNFNSYYEQGFEINLGEPITDVNINDDNVEVNLDMDITITKGEDNFKINSHNLVLDSKLGKLYNNAKKIYSYEQDNLFLEEYGIDVLNLYAPVTDIEITCSPKVWIAEDVLSNVQDALESNTLALKIKGGDYTLKKKENEYFVLDIPIDNGVNVDFINSKDWEYSFEVNPSEGDLLMAQPIGNQQGLGILGFCLAPYHFVYDLKYPVLVQVSEAGETFQFPMAVIIQGNNPREALEGSAVDIQEVPLCDYLDTKVSVDVYNTKMQSVDAEISYECLGKTCSIGETSSGKLTSDFPQCFNGYVLAKADGYEEGKVLFSTNTPGATTLILDKLYEKEIELNLDDKDYSGKAIITFSSDKGVKTVVYSEQKTVELSEGQYEVDVYVYKQGELKLDAMTKEQCVDVPNGIGGVFGLTKKKCFDIQIPEQIVSEVLAGGGKQNYYVLESELINSGKIIINADSLETPKTIEQLQDNYILFENKDLDIMFR